MKYVLLLMGNIADERCGETEEGPGVEEFVAFDAEPEEGTSLSKASRDAEPVITAGPYAESREFVGGTIVLEVDTLDEALAWAAKCPGAIGGRIEVRPILEL